MKTAAAATEKRNSLSGLSSRRVPKIVVLEYYQNPDGTVTVTGALQLDTDRQQVIGSHDLIDESAVVEGDSDEQ